MAFRLPRFRDDQVLVEPKTGRPSRLFHQWWQSFAKAIEEAINGALDALATANTADAKADQAAIDAETALAAVATKLGASDIGVSVQAFDADLSAIAALGTTGLARRTGANTWSLLGSTTVGEGFLTLPNPGAVRFVRINADNSLTARDAAGMLDDIGGTAGLALKSDLIRPSFTNTIAIGGATASISGAGVSFPATQSASTDPNTLDDYEEGTWTPTVTAVTGALTSYTASGVYTKVGRLVIATATASITNNGTGSAALRVTLPFTNNATFNHYGSGRETGTMFVQLMIEAPLAQSYALVARYDGAYSGGTGSIQNFTVAYFV